MVHDGNFFTSENTAWYNAIGLHIAPNDVLPVDALWNAYALAAVRCLSVTRWYCDETGLNGSSSLFGTSSYLHGIIKDFGHLQKNKGTSV